MVGIASVLSTDIPFLRLDLYDIEGKVYFGKLTFYLCAGLEKFYPEILDEKLVDMITVPSKD